MKRKLSLLMPIIRPTVLPMVLILILLSAGQYYLFNERLDMALNYRFDGGANLASFEMLFTTNYIPTLFTVAFGLLTVILALSCLNNGGSNINFTIKRLCLSEKKIHILWGGYCCLCYFILCVWETATIYGLHRLYLASPIGAYSGSMSFFMASYRMDLLHSLMPLSDMTRHFCNLVLLVSLGVCQSIFSLRVRRGQKPIALIVVVWLAAFFFPHGTASLGHDAFLSIALIITTLTAMYNIWGEPYDE